MGFELEKAAVLAPTAKHGLEPAVVSAFKYFVPSATISSVGRPGRLYLGNQSRKGVPHWPSLRKGGDGDGPDSAYRGTDTCASGAYELRVGLSAKGAVLIAYMVGAIDGQRRRLRGPQARLIREARSGRETVR